MKQIKYRKLFGIVFSLVVLSFLVFFSFSKKETFSENENRYLAKFPEFTFDVLKSGKYMEDLQDYLGDHFPFRDFFMNLRSQTEQLLGKEEISDVFIGRNGYLLERYKKPTSSSRIVKNLNDFYKKLNYTNMTLMLVPTSVSINQDLLPKHAPTYNQIDEISNIYDQIKFDTVDLEEAFLNGNKEYPMFYKLDHHWTSYGAYYAYLEYCKQNEIEPLRIQDFEIKEVSDSFYGTLYSKVHDYSLGPDKIHTFIPKSSNYEVNYVQTNRVTDTLYEESYLKKKDQYSYFLDNNHPLITITNKDVTNGKELLILKDSYANSMVPFLVNHFSKVHVIDPRFYKLSISEYVEEHKAIKDILILYNMNTIDTDLGILTIR